MEGVAFAFADCLEALKAAGTSVERATAVGGGSRSRVWLQIIANVLNMPIDIPAEGDFGGAFGAARLGLIAAEDADPIAVCRPPTVQESITPERAAVESLSRRLRALPRALSRHQGGLEVMSTGFFGNQQPVRYEGPESRNPLAFRCYDPDRKVLGKRMEDHLRFAVCYWHSFAWPGTDPFGGQTFLRPVVRRRRWRRRSSRPMSPSRCSSCSASRSSPSTTATSRRKARPSPSRTATSARSPTSSRRRCRTSKVKLLWGTANLFSNRRYMAGAATNPDPDVFAYAAAQVKNALDVTHELSGANYVLWGGREGYETLLNTDMKRELAQLGRFLTMVVEHKEKIGFKGTILIEPKPKEPTKHQYDFDVGTIYGMLKAYDLENKVKINIEQNHAILAGHSFQHEIQLAGALGIFGSLDLNRGDDLLGWDTDQFAMNVPRADAGDARDPPRRRLHDRRHELRRQDPPPVDRARRPAACACRLDGRDRAGARSTPRRSSRTARCRSSSTTAMPAGRASSARTSSPARRASTIWRTTSTSKKLDPQPKSGRQEYLENLVNRF